jgi:uncharacterized protein involved in exopolysaccharide biosynthesis
MSQQRPRLGRFLLIARRRWAVIDAVAMLGLLAGAGYAALSPPPLRSTALVLLPSPVHDIATQRFIATSDPVLARAVRTIHSEQSPRALRATVQVNSRAASIGSFSAQGGTAASAQRTAVRITDPGAVRATVQVNWRAVSIISVSAQGGTAAQAERTADAVASSYVAYVNSPRGPGTPVRARVLQYALNAAGTPPSRRLLVTGGLGALLGALIAAIGVIALGRGHRRFRMK